MKKTLLFLSVIGMACSASGQTLLSENFESYLPGNVGTNFTGATPNDFGIYTQSSNGTAPTTATNAGNDNVSPLGAVTAKRNIFVPVKI